MPEPSERLHPQKLSFWVPSFTGCMYFIEPYPGTVNHWTFPDFSQGKSARFKWNHSYFRTTQKFYVLVVFQRRRMFQAGGGQAWCTSILSWHPAHRQAQGVAVAWIHMEITLKSEPFLCRSSGTLAQLGVSCLCEGGLWEEVLVFLGLG